MSTGRKLLATAGYLVFLALCVEVALQVFYYATAGAPLFTRVGRPFYTADPWAGIWNRPNLDFEHRTNEFQTRNVTNAQGFRVAPGGGDHPLDPPAGTTRIMLLGPSFAYGWGVDYEESFGAFLAGMLEERGVGGGRVELINAGVPSLGAGPHLNWFRHEGEKYRPDLIVQLVYGSMVLKNRQKSALVATEDGYLVPENYGLRQRAVAELKKVATVFYGWVLYTQLRDRFGGDGADDGAVQGAGRELTLGKEFDLEDPEIAEALSFYRDLRDAAAERGAGVVLVYFPLSYAVHPEDRGRWRHLGVHDIEGQRAFDAAFCDHLNRNEGLRCYDITDDLVEAARGDERLYYWLDVHWTPEGNRVVAKAVADRLERDWVQAVPGAN